MLFGAVIFLLVGLALMNKIWESQYVLIKGPSETLERLKKRQNTETPLSLRPVYVFRVYAVPRGVISHHTLLLIRRIFIDIDPEL